MMTCTMTTIAPTKFKIKSLSPNFLRGVFSICLRNVARINIMLGCSHGMQSFDSVPR